MVDGGGGEQLTGVFFSAIQVAPQQYEMDRGLCKGWADHDVAREGIVEMAHLTK